MKLKTLKEIPRLNDESSFVEMEAVKQEAIKWMCWILKKKANPFKAFMKFHNIEHDDLLKGGEDEDGKENM